MVLCFYDSIFRDYDSTWKLLTGQDMVIDIIEDIFHIVIIFQKQ